MSALPVTLKIQRLGAQGDGIAEHKGRQIFVPLALPGETVEVEIEGARARVIRIVEAAPDRAPARCSHYGECGGCTLQHLPDDMYRALKRDLVTTALSFEGIEATVEDVVVIPPATRRRAVFAAHRQGKQIVIGFHGKRSHHIIGLRDCAVLTPGLLALIPRLSQLAAIAAPPKDALTITATETLTGFDIALTGAPKALSADARAQLVQTAGALGLARLSLNGALEMERVAPQLRVGLVDIRPAPGGFLQATRESEAAMLSLVQQAVGDARRIVDLFSGAGTFSLPLATNATIHAVESDELALASLQLMARRTSGLKPVTTEKRDLFRRPLVRTELRRFDAAVIDPPRAGAEAQTRELAVSDIKRVAMVSCNAATFSRDLKIMLASGWRVTRISPVDQFLWSSHIEIVAALERNS
ncbi:MAG: class I SAM-dependent RNA methyltransferase [Hyphomonadaceae bacterium]